MITLVIDASTYRGTVAVFRGEALLASGAATMRGAQSEALMPAVADVLSRGGVALDDVHRVACGEGPGSFTSLRIAASIAKGICLGRGIPLFAVSSLGLAAAASALGGTFVVAIDALRNEWYAAPFRRDATGAIAAVSQVALVARDALDVYAQPFGPVADAAEPDAAACAALFGEMERRGPVDLERWEPSYGRLAEAQVKWEAAHGRPLGA